MDTLSITGLLVHTRIGTYAWEQHINQRLLLDLVLPVDCRDCADDLTKTLNYETLCQDVKTLVESRSFQLIETVANEVAVFICETYKVAPVTVSVSKPDAIKQAKNVQITVTRPAP